jgi:hypothetical protein
MASFPIRRSSFPGSFKVRTDMISFFPFLKKT